MATAQYSVALAPRLFDLLVIWTPSTALAVACPNQPAPETGIAGPVCDTPTGHMVRKGEQIRAGSLVAHLVACLMGTDAVAEARMLHAVNQQHQLAMVKQVQISQLLLKAFHLLVLPSTQKVGQLLLKHCLNRAADTHTQSVLGISLAAVPTARWVCLLVQLRLTSNFHHLQDITSAF